MASNDIMELATLIYQSTKQCNDYFESAATPVPSHEAIPPSRNALPEHVVAAKDTAIEATQKLHDLLIGPMAYVFSASIDFTKMLSLQFIYRHRIADLLSPNGETTFEDISQHCGIDEDDTRRFLRLAMTNHFFQEPRTGVVTHTAESSLLANNPRLMAWVGNSTEEIWPALTKVVDAAHKWPGSQEPTETGYSLAHKIKTTPFELWNEDPWRAERFAKAMEFAESTPDLDPKFLVEALDLNDIKDGTVVDVGGSHGVVAILLAKHYPQIRCIVQDLPATIADAPSELPSDVSGRISFQIHDFFTEQLVMGADVFLFRWIFHNWSDKYCIQILRNLIPALKKGAKIVVNDACIPEVGLVPQSVEKRIRGSDMVMKAFLNAKERDLESWRSLFVTADHRFRLRKTLKPSKSRLTIFIVEWEGDALVE